MAAGLETVLDAIQRNADVSARLLIAAEAIRQAQESPMPGGVHQIVMQPPDSGERAVHRVEKANYMLIGLFVGLLIGGWTLLDRLSADARDLKREQQRTADYQAMLWQRYPELRPENLKPKEDKKP
jgi:hypothetical protein